MADCHLDVWKTKALRQLRRNYQFVFVVVVWFRLLFCPPSPLSHHVSINKFIENFATQPLVSFISNSDWHYKAKMADLFRIRLSFEWTIHFISYTIISTPKSFQRFKSITIDLKKKKRQQEQKKKNYEKLSFVLLLDKSWNKHEKWGRTFRLNQKLVPKSVATRTFKKGNGQLFHRLQLTMEKRNEIL